MPATSLVCPPTASARARRRSGLAAVLAAGFLLLAVPGAADAAVTQSAVTSIAGGASTPFATHVSALGNGAAQNRWTVSGTSNGSTGDQVDLSCRYLDPPSEAAFASSVPVQPDGSFTAEASISSLAVGGVCDLRAIPAGSTPADVAPFAARRVGVGQSDDRRISGSGGPNEGQMYDLYDSHPQRTGFVDYESLGAGGLYDMVLNDGIAQGNILFYENAALGRSDIFQGTERPDAVIDGAPAYAPAAANSINSLSAGLPALQHTQQTDPATGDVTMTESDPLVTCATFPTTTGSTDCPTFTPTGVTVDRTITQDHEGRMVRIVDVLRSTDGVVHSYALQYEQTQNSSGVTSGYRFPGEAAYTARAAGNSVNGPATAVSTVGLQYDLAQPVSLVNPVGGLTVSPAPNDFSFNDPGTFHLHEVGSIPAGGTRTIRQTFTLAASQQELDGLVAEAEDGQQAPTVTIAGPDTVTQPSVAVTGTAKALRGLRSLTVNGAAVAVAGDGTWSATVPLAPGSNTITATATNSAGLTATATKTVGYAPAGPPPGPPAPPTGTPSPPVKAHVTLGSIKVSGTRVLLSLSCRAASGRSCAGRVTLTTKLRKRGAKRSSTVKLASRAFTVAAGKRTTVKLTLSRSARSLLRRHRKLRVRAAATLTAGGTTARTVTLKAPVAKHAKRT